MHKFKVSRKRGVVVIKYGMKSVILYARDETLILILPKIPKDGETITFECKVEKSNA